MAGGAQGGGGRPAQANPQGMQQYQNMLQNYRQGMAGAPSQMPGANVAAPGGGMAQPAVMPQGMGNMLGDMMYRPPGGMPTPQPQQQLNPFANVPQQPGMGNMLVGGPAQGVPGGPGGPQQYQPAPFNPGMGNMLVGGPAQGVPGGPYAPQPQQQLNSDLAKYMNAPGTGQIMQGATPQPSQQLNPFVNPSQQPAPRPMPRPMPMPQVQGNPNATPLQRPQMQGRPTMQMLRGRR